MTPSGNKAQDPLLTRSSTPGAVLCSETTRLYLINYARTLIYTTALSFPSLVGIQVAYDFVMSGQAEPLRAHLRNLSKTAHGLLLDICRRQRPPPELLRLDTGEPKTPIVPVLTCLPRGLAKHCQKRGFMVRPIVAPTVPKGKERIRVCLHAGNTLDDVEGLARAVEEWVVAWMSGTVEPEMDDQEDAGKTSLALTRSKGRKGKL